MGSSHVPPVLDLWGSLWHVGPMPSPLFPVQGKLQSFFMLLSSRATHPAQMHVFVPRYQHHPHVVGFEVSFRPIKCIKNRGLLNIVSRRPPANERQLLAIARGLLSLLELWKKPDLWCSQNFLGYTYSPFNNKDRPRVSGGAEGI